MGRCWATPSTYAKCLHIYAEGVCGESLLNLHSVLTAIPLFRSIFLSCQFTDGCKLGRKCCSNIFQSHATDSNALLKTDFIVCDKSCHRDWKLLQCYINIRIMCLHLVCTLQQTKNWFWQNLPTCLCDGWVDFQRASPVYVYDTSVIFSDHLKNRYPGLFAYFLSCA